MLVQERLLHIESVMDKHVSYDEIISKKLQQQMQEERRMEIEMVNAQAAAKNMGKDMDEIHPQEKDEWPTINLFLFKSNLIEMSKSFIFKFFLCIFCSAIYF